MDLPSWFCRVKFSTLSPTFMWQLLGFSVATIVFGQSGEGLFERGGILDVESLLIAIDLAHEAGEDFARAYFDEVSSALGDEELDAFDPTNRAGYLADEAV